MRRPFLTGLCLAWAGLAAGAACSSFAADDTPGGADGGDEASQLPEAATPDGSTADVVTKPGTSCPLVPTAPLCLTACEETLPALPPSLLAPGVVNDARITVHDGTVYVARVVDRTSAELFSYTGTSASWTLLGSYPARAVFGLAVNDTTILLSLAESLADGAPTNQQVVEVDVHCSAACKGNVYTLDSTRAGPGVVTLGQHFYFSSENHVSLSMGGPPTLVAAEFADPVVAADCTQVYYSNAFDHDVHRYDEKTGLSAVIGTEVGVFDASAFEGGFAGTMALAAANDQVFASTGSGLVYAMPKDPVHAAKVIAGDAGRGSVLVADSRAVYYAELRGFLSYAIVRVDPVGGERQVLSSSLTAVGMASDADHLYVVEPSGQVTRLAK
jgi:hypothetical protein